MAQNGALLVTRPKQTPTHCAIGENVLHFVMVGDNYSAGFDSRVSPLLPFAFA